MHPKITCVPQEGGVCKGGSRNVEGWGDPLNENKKFQRVDVPEFQSFIFRVLKVSKLQFPKFPSFQVTPFQIFEFSKFRRFKDSKIHFHVFDRYWPILTTCQFTCFSGRDFSHIRAFQNVITRIFGISCPPHFSMFKMCDFQNVAIS